MVCVYFILSILLSYFSKKSFLQLSQKYYFPALWLCMRIVLYPTTGRCILKLLVPIPRIRLTYLVTFIKNYVKHYTNEPTQVGILFEKERLLNKMRHTSICYASSENIALGGHTTWLMLKIWTNKHVCLCCAFRYHMLREQYCNARGKIYLIHYVNRLTAWLFRPHLYRRTSLLRVYVLREDWAKVVPMYTSLHNE